MCSQKNVVCELWVLVFVRAVFSLLERNGKIVFGSYTVRIETFENEVSLWISLKTQRLLSVERAAERAERDSSILIQINIYRENAGRNDTGQGEVVLLRIATD